VSLRPAIPRQVALQQSPLPLHRSPTIAAQSQCGVWLRSSVALVVSTPNGVSSLLCAQGIGENAPPVRERICDGLGFLGIELDRERNAKNAPLFLSDTVRVKVRVIRTDEELMIARSTARVLNLGSIRET
jgi:acetate kinase